MSAHCSTSHPLTDFVVNGPAEIIREIVCGPQDHNEHCKAWRWKEYVKHDADRMDNVMAEIRKMRDEREARLTSQQLADIELAAWQERRRA